MSSASWPANVSGGGASNRIAYWNGGASLTSSADLTYDGTTFSLLNGDLSFGSSVNGLSRIIGGAGSFILADNATKTLALGTNCNGLLIVSQNTNGYAAIFHVHAGDSTGIAIMSDPLSKFSITSGTANKTNVFNTSGAGTITVENKNGGSKSFNVSFVRNG